MTRTILIVDNQSDYAETLKKYLERFGYSVITVTASDKAQHVLDTKPVDVALIDLRLHDENVDDPSGLLLAKNSNPHVPKILLSAHNKEEIFPLVIEAMEISSVGTQAAVRFVSKGDGHEAILATIREVLDIKSNLQAVSHSWETQLMKWDTSAMDSNYRQITKQAHRAFRTSNWWAHIGTFLVFMALILVALGLIAWELAAVVSASAVVTQLINGFFFQQLDKVNKRMDDYHKELVEGYRLDLLMTACDGVDVKTMRNDTKQKVLEKLAEHWFENQK